MLNWSSTFIPLFFGIDASTIVESVGGEAENLARQTSGVSTRRKKAGEEVDLLKSIMKRTREAVHRKNKLNKDGESVELESQPPSRTSTPAIDKESDIDTEEKQDVSMADDKEIPDAEEALNIAEQETRVWAELNTDANVKVTGAPVQPIEATEAETRVIFNFFTNSTFYCFMRWFQMVYERLANIKSLEEEVTRELKLRKPNTTAVQLGLVQARMVALGLDFDDDANHYQQLLALAEQLIEGATDQASFEDMLRYIYGTKAFKVYTIDKLIALMAKQIQLIVSEEKNIIQTQAFAKDRVKTIITPREQIIYRIQTETTIGAHEQLYRHEWNNAKRILRIQHVGKDDASLADAVTKEEAWKYYVDSWTIAKPTYGVPQDSVKPCLDRNLQHLVVGDDETAMIERYQDARLIESHLQMKVCINTYKIFYVPGTEDRLLLRHPKWPDATPQAAEERIKEKADSFEQFIKERLPASVGKLSDEQQFGKVFDGPAETATVAEAEDVQMDDA
jgi:paired amphipathic helix protein Sin3a